MSGKKKLLLGVLLAGLAAFVAGAWSGRIPVRPLLTFLQFRLRPDKVRTQQLLKLHNKTSDQTVFLLGTTHQYHYEDDDYSIWHVKAVVTGVGADAVFIEMMADAVDAPDQSRWGEGPVEMPFIAFAAKEAGLPVFGVDHGWDGGWRGRQDGMYAQVKARLPAYKTALITSGFMHVSQFQRQLEEDGFVVVDWSDDDKRAVVDRDVKKTWPPGLEQALVAAIARAKAGEMSTDPERQADMKWFVEVREMVLKKIRA